MRQTRSFRRLGLALLRILPAVISLLAILLFEDGPMVIPFLSAVLLHEIGHLFAFSILGEPLPKLASGSGGFRLLSRRSLDPKSEFVITVAGPLFNLLAIPPLVLLSHSHGEYFLLVAAISGMTAISNLIPIGELDGAKLLRILTDRLTPSVGEAVRLSVSYLFISVMLFLSLAFLYLSGSAFYTSLSALLLLLTLK